MKKPTKKQLALLAPVYQTYGRSKYAKGELRLTVYINHAAPELAEQLAEIGGEVTTREFPNAKVDSRHRFNHTWSITGADAQDLAAYLAEHLAGQKQEELLNEAGKAKEAEQASKEKETSRAKS